MLKSWNNWPKKNPLRIISNCSQVAGHKVKIQNLQNHLPIYQQWTSAIWNEKHNTIYNSTPQEEILWNINLTKYV